MKFFIDTEFVEDGKTIDLISIGIVGEDEREYYAVSEEFDMEKAKDNPFVGPIVLPLLGDAVPKSRAQIGQEIFQFVGRYPEFWADHASYDWVALCQLYGPMVDLPDTWPMFCRDVEQYRHEVGVRPFEVWVAGKPHNALRDARDCKARHHFIAGEQGEDKIFDGIGKAVLAGYRVIRDVVRPGYDNYDPNGKWFGRHGDFREAWEWSVEHMKGKAA